MKFFQSNICHFLRHSYSIINILGKKPNLFNIMMTYSVYHPNRDYSQEMIDMFTPIVYVFIDQFNQLINDLWKKIYSNEENSFLVYRWLLLDCKREVH